MLQPCCPRDKCWPDHWGDSPLSFHSAGDFANHLSRADRASSEYLKWKIVPLTIQHFPSFGIWLYFYFIANDIGISWGHERCYNNECVSCIAIWIWNVDPTFIIIKPYYASCHGPDNGLNSLILRGCKGRNAKARNFGGVPVNIPVNMMKWFRKTLVAVWWRVPTQSVAYSFPPQRMPDSLSSLQHFVFCTVNLLLGRVEKNGISQLRRAIMDS